MNLALDPARRPGRRTIASSDPLEPYVASASDPWDAAKAAHLARRTGFGATPEEVRRLVSLGLERAVAERLDFPEAEPELDLAIRAQGSVLGVDGMGGGADGLRAWWVFRMAYTRHPLRERLALLWHDHFACAESKVVRGALLCAQNELFRRLARASFGELLASVARDGAMLVFLDNRLNHRERPNENWSRELCELFTLGLDRYTQEDVREIARAFTGWSTPAAHLPQFLFRPEDHDPGDKRVFGVPLRGRSGEAGVEEGDEVLARILAREDCARFLAGKLCAWFVSSRPRPELQAALAGRLFASGYSIHECLRALFASRAFYDAENRFTLYKNPLELAVSAVRALAVQNAHLLSLERSAERMGMLLFEPPSVAGWPEGEDWIQPGHLIERCNFALALASLPHTRHPVAGSPALDLDLLAPSASRRAGELVDELCERILQRPLRAEQRQNLVRHIDRMPREPRRERVRAALHLLLSTPEFALA